MAVRAQERHDRDVAIAMNILCRYTCYMSAADCSYDISARADRLEVRGVREDELTAALELLNKVRAVQAEHVASTRDDLVHALMAANVSLTPPASLAQAQRLATHRDALLATPVFSYETLQKLRGDTAESSTRTWVARRREVHQLFTVTHKGRTLIPAFQLDERGATRTELQPILSTLITAGIEGWSLWTWLTSPTGLLSGQVPEQVAHSAPARALRAAQRFAAPHAA